VQRGDRDAKATRAAFKLAAMKRINSPGSLDLLIRAAVAFLRGLDRLHDLTALRPPALPPHVYILQARLERATRVFTVFPVVVITRSIKPIVIPMIVTEERDDELLFINALWDIIPSSAETIHGEMYRFNKQAIIHTQKNAYIKIKIKSNITVNKM